MTKDLESDCKVRPDIIRRINFETLINNCFLDLNIILNKRISSQ